MNDLVKHENTSEMELVRQEYEQQVTLPDYAILNPEIPMSAKVEVATKVANTLAPLVREQGLAIKGLNKKNPEAEYVMVEGWEILGTFLGIVPVTTIIKDLKNKHGHTIGYRSRGTLYRNPIIKNDEIVGGTVIARAEAQADKNGWQKDLFAIASMSQTRALGKAYRMGLSWIMKMAGFEGTPAEEMPKFKETEIIEAQAHTKVKTESKTEDVTFIDAEAEEVTEPSGFETADNIEPADDTPLLENYAKSIATRVVNEGNKITRRTMRAKCFELTQNGIIPMGMKEKLYDYIDENCPGDGK